jgi:hypothetical protein
VVLSIDEKSQIQALDRTQPGLPIKARALPDHDPRLQAARHHHPVRRLQRARRRRHGRCMQRHRHVEFIRFLNTVEREVAADNIRGQR